MTGEYIYHPRVFTQPSETAAKAVILTHEGTLTTEQRWEQETAYLRPFLNGLPDGLVLDYGCGIGRLAKVLLEDERAARGVFGVDISASMREQAEDYVGDARFAALSLAGARLLARIGFRMDAAVAAWVLQHIPILDEAVDLIADLLRVDAPLLLVNQTGRAIPVVAASGEGGVRWLNDGADLDGAMLRRFSLTEETALPLSLLPGVAYVRLYRRLP